MDLFFFHKADHKPIPRSSNLLQVLAKLFRFLELCLVLLFLSWILFRLPFAVRISGEYFARLFGFLASPLFGFILCNAIIVALVAKPSQFSGRSTVAGETDRLYEDLVVKSGSGDVPESLSEEVEIVYQDKEIIAELVINSIDRHIEVKNADPDPEAELGIDGPKVIRRTQSEKIKRECSKTQSEKLRRSETEKCRNLEDSQDIVYNQDDLSSEEFQRKIEAFIAREKKFRREESSAIVLHYERRLISG